MESNSIMIRSLVKTIRKIYSESKGTMMFKASESISSDSPALREILEAIGRYNDFDPSIVCRMLRKFKVSMIPAREYSACLYLFPDPEEDREELKKALKYVAADEIHDQEDGSIRAWWD